MYESMHEKNKQTYNSHSFKLKPNQIAVISTVLGGLTSVLMSPGMVEILVIASSLEFGFRHDCNFRDMILGTV